MEDIKKCTQCGASLPQNSDRCEYCGTVYKSDTPQVEPKSDKSNKKGDIISDFGGFGDFLSEIFDFTFDD